MKKILSCLMMLIAFSAFAQTPATDQPKKTNHEKGNAQKTPDERATALASHLETSLGLTADQKTKVHDLALTREQKMDQLHQQNKGNDRCAWYDQRKQTQDEFNSGMKNVLTPDQYTKWNTEKQERIEKRSAHFSQSKKTPEQRADTLSSRLEKYLGLTADQKAKVHDLVLTREQTNDQLREKYKGQDPCAWSGERKTVQDNFDNGMKATLTPDQYQKWQDYKKQNAQQRKRHRHHKEK